MPDDYTEVKDEELVVRYLEAKDSSAFEELCARYAVPLYRFTMTYVRERDVAEDVVQQSFVKMWKSLRTFDTEKKFSVWVYTIARRTALDELRKRKIYLFSTLSEDGEVSFEDMLSDEGAFTEKKLEDLRNVNAFEEILKKIPEHKAEIVFLKLYEDMTFEEIASAVGRPMNTIKSIYRRTLKDVQDELVSVYHVERDSFAPKGD